jgi:hypothetical protein
MPCVARASALRASSAPPRRAPPPAVPSTPATPPARALARPVPIRLARGVAATAAALVLALVPDPTPARADEPTAAGPAPPSPLECAADPACVAERDAALAVGSYAAPTEYVDEDPDGALRRAICPRNPTADVCRSVKDRKKVNDSPCKVPILNACLVWKEGANRDVVLKR